MPCKSAYMFFKWLMNFLGLRGPLGAGFSKMNDLTVIQTSQVTTWDYKFLQFISNLQFSATYGENL